MSKKILIFHSSNDLYGASKILLQVINILISSGYETHVFLPYRGPLDKIFSEIQNKNITKTLKSKVCFKPINRIN